MRLLHPTSAGVLALVAGLAGMPARAASDTDRAFCERQQGSARVVCLRDLDKPPPPAAAAPAPTPAAAAGPAAAPSPSPSMPPSAPADTVGTPPYQVQGGTVVDARTYQGFQTWRAAACDRCHGANQQGLVGPSLIEGLKHLSPGEFRATVLNGRLDKGMPSFASSPTVSANLDALYAYLKGRSDGAITQAHVQRAGGG